MNNKWLKWAKELQSIAQSGLEYSKDPYDIERFEQIRTLSIEIMSDYTDIEPIKVRHLFANESGYQTPKVDVRAVIIKDHKILMVKEQLDGKWSLPGGWADIDLSVKENVIKESLEEAGAVVCPKRILALLDRQKHVSDVYPYAIYKIFVECDYVKGDFQDNLETLGADFFPLDALPPLSLTRNTFEQIKMCFDSAQTECHEAIFD